MDPVVGILKKDAGARLPEYETPGAAGADIRARLEEPVTIPPLGRARIPTGLVLEIPPGYEAQVRPRSGLAFHRGITVLNSPGTIDSDYRGELEIILVNLGSEPFSVTDGDRVAQLIVSPVCRAFMRETGELSGTERGDGGFGSTGV
ncbi:MAG: dUTP diphosphatase [Spirochaetaceae bacterium]|jgi:dUTP pyrophosphatase|nr:dUTP diphosphatase [Spirochaetaceae bacterium]